MAAEFTKCRYIDPISQLECDVWYPFYDSSEHFCPRHRLQEPPDGKEVQNHIPRTVTVISSSAIQKLNDKVAECSKMSIQEIIEHIISIEAKIKELESDRRAANIAKRNLEDRLSEEDRTALRENSRSYKVPADPDSPPKTKPKKTPEEKAQNRKEGFSAWAARLGVKVDELMVMDDDEMASRIAKYKASKG